MDVPGLQTVAAAPYLFRPFLMLMFLGIVAGLVGVIINLRCLEFNAEAMVHSVFPGIVAGAVYGGLDMIIPGAAVCAVFIVIALTAVGRRSTKVSESGTAVVLTSFFSAGIVLSLYKGDRSGQLEALMFGRLLEVTPERFVESVVVCLIALTIITVSWKEQIFTAFDRDGARAAGISGFAVDLMVNGAIAAVVVSSASAVGVLLVIGYLVVPGATARLLVDRVSLMIPVAIAVGVIGGYAGMIIMTLDTPHPVSPQASVALSVIALFFLALPVRWLRTRFSSGRATDAGGTTTPSTTIPVGGAA
ncbi:metal ABC transporter permease [Corynebacterium pygosceleis]|uniref:Metal ABC transporter permease n=1 Tax=Corynebacterium pygosceleis TaxID=2800406 RepID=A0A9Q4C9Q5_9CORY|nr:metal ABC transporter permease [Corynebacterium pygosceleis]MCK7637611.1 metal ABC transporter permease [Corynebacterium pygosceleis]MCK7674802.1 metal ABC transporter permease [Corynebacterium pygosceleis]MCL0119609.1 metal ABC transporter permease [Corynebacterium pygosceleis]MCX7444850.1 metal ABC transporter permease [Corynebacterium pygosceleis]MCX7468060.1 metal ABC transporter permease [Corynebacterium pygosceleis]